MLRLELLRIVLETIKIELCLKSLEFLMSISSLSQKIEIYRMKWTQIKETGAREKPIAWKEKGNRLSVKIFMPFCQEMKKLKKVKSNNFHSFQKLGEIMKMFWLIWIKKKLMLLVIKYQLQFILSAENSCKIDNLLLSIPRFWEFWQSGLIISSKYSKNPKNWSSKDNTPLLQ